MRFARSTLPSQCCCLANLCPFHIILASSLPSSSHARLSTLLRSWRKRTLSQIWRERSDPTLWQLLIEAVQAGAVKEPEALGGIQNHTASVYTGGCGVACHITSTGPGTRPRRCGHASSVARSASVFVREGACPGDQRRRLMSANALFSAAYMRLFLLLGVCLLDRRCC